MFDFTNLIKRKEEIDHLYSEISRRFAEDPVFLEKLSEDYAILIKIIDAAQKNPVLQEVATTAGTSIDSVRRWAGGKLPSTFAYATNNKIDLDKLKQMENFIFLLGVYQAQTLTTTQRTTFTISTQDEILSPSLENCINSCFGKELKEKNHKFEVNSIPLMTMIKNLTNDNTTVPTELLITQNKRDIYYSGFLTGVKVTLEPHSRAHKNKYMLHAALTRSRGNIMNSVDQYLDDKGLEHSYYENQSRIRFRGKQCIELAKILPKCTAKETIQKQKKYA